MATGDVDGSLTGVVGKLEPVRPAQGETRGLVNVLGGSGSICGILYRAHRSHGTAAVDGVSDVAAGNVDEGVAANHTRLRVVVLLAVIAGVGVRAATCTIDVATVGLGSRIEFFKILIRGISLCHAFRNEAIPRVGVIGNTDGAAIDVHLGALVIVAVLTAAIDGTLDERSG